MTNTEILGTICRVILPEENSQLVYKYPINPKRSAKELYQRYTNTAKRVSHWYEKICPPGQLIIPEMTLNEEQNRIEQVRVHGKMLGRINDQELASLPKQTLISLEGLLTCVTKIHEYDLNTALQKNPPQKYKYVDFLDIFGYDQGLNFIKKVIRSTNVRYSPNIMISESDSSVNLVDPDFYYDSCRNVFTRFTASVSKDKMLRSVDKFKEQLQSYI